MSFNCCEIYLCNIYCGDRCHKLLESGKYDAIYVHGLGAAVDRAVNIALQLKVTSAGCVAPLEVSANTSSINLIDDFIPVDDDHETRTRSRRSSAIHIKVYHVGTSCASDTAAFSLKDCGKMPADTQASKGDVPQQEPTSSKPQKKSKKKPKFTKMQFS